MHRHCRLHPCAIWALLDPQEIFARHMEVTMLELRLTPLEVRILGVLLEKEVTTPEYYPLTLNALTRACNQKSNRHPVVDYDEKTVLQALDGLTFDKDLAKRVISDDSRVPKYRQALSEKLHLTRPEAAALCILMLRGPQTLGEMRGRTERLHDFATIEAVETTLQGLLEHVPAPLVTRLPRQLGHKEVRYAHLLAGDVVPEAEDMLEPAASGVREGNDRLIALEQEVAALTEELEALKQAFVAFKKQFE
jgi:uncharacterized protein YceH (UPF0502 family)